MKEVNLLSKMIFLQQCNFDFTVTFCISEASSPVQQRPRRALLLLNISVFLVVDQDRVPNDYVFHMGNQLAFATRVQIIACLSMSLVVDQDRVPSVQLKNRWEEAVYK